MTWIQLPRVEIEDSRITLAVDGPQAHAREGVRVEPEVGSPGNGQVRAEEAPGGDRKLYETGHFAHSVGPAGSVGDAVPVIVHREDRGVVAEPQFCQHVQRPQGLPCHREEGGAVAEDLPSGQPPQSLRRARHLGTKRVQRHPVDELMRLPMRPHLVTSVADLTHQLRMPLGDLAEHEEGGAGLCGGEHVEKPPAGCADPVFEAVPMLALDLEPLVPVLEVDGECVEHGPPLGSPHSLV
jgi:hypothetical protein